MFTAPVTTVVVHEDDGADLPSAATMRATSEISLIGAARQGLRSDGHLERSYPDELSHTCVHKHVNKVIV